MSVWYVKGKDDTRLQYEHDLFTTPCAALMINPCDMEPEVRYQGNRFKEFMHINIPTSTMNKSGAVTHGTFTLYTFIKQPR